MLGERVVTCDSNPDVKLTIRLLPPRRTAVDYECPFELVGPGIHIKRFGAGLDAIQAIQLAFVAIGGHLSAIESKWGCRFKWEDGDAGFPRP